MIWNFTGDSSLYMSRENEKLLGKLYKNATELLIGSTHKCQAKLIGKIRNPINSLMIDNIEVKP